MTNTLHRSLDTVFRELLDGPDAAAAWMLNGGDAGLLRSLDKLTASAASGVPARGGASIATHVRQTIGREVLLVLDHAAYHLGELVLLRRLLGIWP